MSGGELRGTACAICGTFDNADTVFPANFTPEDLNAAIFSARRMPDRVHYRIVRCRKCGLVRSDPVADPAQMAKLYAESTFDYGGEVENLKKTYGRYLAKLKRFGVTTGAILEVGCGNGFFLEEAKRQGYTDLRGVEPSQAAVALAAPDIRPGLVCDMMREGLFEPASFDVACLFQVFDHIPDPGQVLDECLKALKPGGLILILNHNVSSFSAKILGERSPIIDIEHTYLYDRATLGKLVEKHGFTVRGSGSVWNTYSLKYLCRLLPLPSRLKAGLLKLMSRSPLGNIPLRVPLGNLYLVAERPRAL